MSETAQKKDIQDPEVLLKFSQKVGQIHTLNALYLLTFADIRATGPNIWNNWKNQLLEELYLSTYVLLQKENDKASATLIAEKTQKLIHQLTLNGPIKPVIQSLWKQLDPTYFMRHRINEMTFHAQEMVKAQSIDKPFIRAQFEPKSQNVQFMIYLPDKRGLFTRLCSFFAQEKLNITEAKIYTTHHHYALDTFNVFPTNTTEEFTQDKLTKLEAKLFSTLAQESISLPTLGTLTRRMKLFPITPKLEIESEDNRHHHTLTITAADRTGLLAHIANLFIKYDLNIHSARISTQGERVEDTFQLSGSSLNELNNQLAFEKDIFAIIDQI